MFIPICVFDANNNPILLSNSTSYWYEVEYAIIKMRCDYFESEDVKGDT